MERRTGRDAVEHALASAYRVLLTCYPSEFRHDYGADMLDTFIDQLRPARAHGLAASLAFLLAAVADVIATGFRERFSLSAPRSRVFHLMDVRHAFRQLRRTPLFSLLTMVVLSGGLAVSIFTFSFLHTAISRPLPLRHGERIVRIEQRIGADTRALDAADVALLRKDVRTLNDVGIFDTRDVVIGDGDDRRVLQVTATEWNLFRIAATPPALGRGLRPSDHEPGAEPAIVLSERIWRTQFGSNAGIVGTLVRINGIPTRVVGVMPRGFGFPVAADSWMPMSRDVLQSTVPERDFVELYGLLAPGATRARAVSELSLLLDRARVHNRGAREALRLAQARMNSAPAPNAAVSNAGAADSAALAPRSMVVRTFPMAQIGDDAPLVLTVLNALAALILLLACINVMNLLLARANERARETAVRLALGASRARLIVQSMWESAILTLGGGIIALALAAWALDFINSWAQSQLSGNLAFWWVWGLDRSSVMAGIVFIAGTIGVLGITVSARATSMRVTAVLNDGGARSGGRREGRMARALVVAQVATVSVLMFFGVLSGIVAWRVVHVDFGYDTHRLLSATIESPANAGATASDAASRRRSVFGRALQALVSSPDVDQAMLSVPLAGMTDVSGAFAQRDVVLEVREAPRAWIEAVQGSLGTLGMVATAGRLLDSRDDAADAATAVISASLARKHFRGATPIGKQLRLTGLDSTPRWFTVVGVASNVLHGNPLSRDRSSDAIYVPLSQFSTANASAIVRHRGNVAAAQVALYRAASDANTQALPPSVRSYDELIAKTTLIARSTTKLFALCFGFALLMAVSGTYGLMARSIGQRTREIGVRRALGASTGNVTRLLLTQGARQLGVGVLIAVPIMAGVGFGFASYFPIGIVLTVGGAALVVSAIVGVVLTATWVPTRRVVGMGIRDALWRE